MKSSDPPDIPLELKFLSDCLVAISNQEYRSALEVTRVGLKGILECDVPVDPKQLASLFYMTAGYLESKLKEAYGEQWEKHIEIPEIPAKEKEVRCSFCGKEQREVKKIIGGAGIFICDGCVGICNQILEGESPSSSNGARA